MSKRSSEVQAQNINNFWKRMDFSTFQKVLRKWCELLEAHNGRDKVIRITGFTCTLISDFPVNSLERGILKSFFNFTISFRVSEAHQCQKRFLMLEDR